MIQEFAPAKINLALHVLGRRADGYHELDSVVAFADVGDVLMLEEATETSLEVTGPFASGLDAGPSNLVLRAYEALSTVTPLPPVHFTLEKNLPVASGIGGGSADAAAALRGLLRLTSAHVAAATLREVALKLGADVPVCLHGKSCRMGGIGENLAPLDGLAGSLLLVNPLVTCSTASVFGALGLNRGQSHGSAIDAHDRVSWRNDLQAPACGVQPIIKEVLRELSVVAQGAMVRMSGSGATCFAWFDNAGDAVSAADALKQARPQWWITATAMSA